MNKAYAAGIAIGVGGAAVLLAWPVLTWYYVKKLEKPKYVVVRSVGKLKHWMTGRPVVEIRKYAPYLIAEVAVGSNGTMRDSLNEGFRQVARFIFGDNVRDGVGADTIAMTSPVAAQKETIAMTSPVVAQKSTIAMTSPVAAEPSADGKVWKVSFMMPSKYTLDNIPKPKNPAVELKLVPERTLAAISFNGSMPTQAGMDAWRDKLLAELAREGIEVEGEPMLWQYHPPFTPGFVRVNEVLYSVKE